MQQKLLPPRLFQICLVLIAALDVVFGERPIFASGAVLALGILTFLAGAALTLGGAGQFNRRKTNINTFRKPDHLVTDGLFRYSRNPMYLGFSTALIGAAIIFNSFIGLAVAAAFILITDRWYIAFEETLMAETFGQAYADYRQTTRRWI
jgi:protein-S-isoprenylcysteine O-methyltransferase Ste14